MWRFAARRRLNSLPARPFPTSRVAIPERFVRRVTAIPLCLLTAALFDLSTGLWAAALWSFGVTAITYNRIGKEDTLMVFFMLFAFYLFIQAKKVDRTNKKLVGRLLNLSAVSFGLMMASKYFPHYLGLNMLYHHNYSVRQPKPEEPRWKTPLAFSSSWASRL